MKPSRLFIPLVLASLAPQATTAEPLTDAQREAIKSRMQSLQLELRELRDRLQNDNSPEPSPGLYDGVQDTKPAALAKESARGPNEEQELEESVATRRLLEQESEQNPFAITTHRRNYLLPLSYTSTPNEAAFNGIDNQTEADHLEMQFQFSAKFQLADLLPAGGELYFGYTQRSWWQAYNTDASSPFRETNYEPEIFADFENDWSFAGWTNINNRLSLNHQSNGRSGGLSRSWNRVILTSTFVSDDWGISFSPFWRIPESSSEDDNPDIEDYMGYGDITVAKRLFDDHEASLMVRGNPDQGHLGAQLDYSWPLFGKVRGHVQYYTGYGESLIDYDRSVHRLGIGFSLNPLFSSGVLER